MKVATHGMNSVGQKWQCRGKHQWKRLKNAELASHGGGGWRFTQMILSASSGTHTLKLRFNP